MNIKDFLLARIAEDEEQAEVCKVMRWVPAKKYGITVTHPTRVLAECAAKRELVDAWHDEHGGGHVLRTLATIYAAHPDYQQRWAV